MQIKVGIEDEISYYRVQPNINVHVFIMFRLQAFTIAFIFNY